MRLAAARLRLENLRDNRSRTGRVSNTFRNPPAVERLQLEGKE
jgi:hypothetical protein